MKSVFVRYARWKIPQTYPIGKLLDFVFAESTTTLSLYATIRIAGRDFTTEPVKTESGK
jgi:hypothetical protein